MKDRTTVNDIIAAIAQKIDVMFQGKYQVYTDKTEQDFQVPCFFIRLSQLREDPFFYNRRKKIATFEITFFQKQDNAEERNTVADEMRRILRFLEVSTGIIRGIRYEGTVSDGVLVMMIQFHYFVTEEYEKEVLMHTLTERRKVKE